MQIFASRQHRYYYNSYLLGESLKGAINGVITPLVRQVTIKERRSDHIP